MLALNGPKLPGNLTPACMKLMRQFNPYQYLLGPHIYAGKRVGEYMSSPVLPLNLPDAPELMNGPVGQVKRRGIMLYYAAVFFVIALVAALFGFGGIAAGAAEIAKILFFIFLVIFVVTLILGILRR